MENPFPGMNPYLEGSLWSTVHSALINEMATDLTLSVAQVDFNKRMWNEWT